SAFAYCPLPRGNRVAVITGSGGSAVWMADILSAHGLELPVIEENLQRRIMALLPSYASAQNPIDATAQAIGEVGYAPMVELVAYGRFREKLTRRKPVEATAPALREDVARSLAAARPVLTEVASKKLLARYGVPLPPEALATSEDEAIAAASRIGSAVALKVQSPDILHKTEAGGVMLGLSGDAVRDGYRTVLARAKAAYPNAKIDGVLVQAM